MLEEELLKRLKAKFPLYSEPMLEADWFYYRNNDPSHFLRLAAQFELPAYKSDDQSTGYDLLPNNDEKFDAVKASFLRFLRYLSSETAVLLLVSGYPRGPVPKTMVSLRNDELTAIFKSVAGGKVPKGFGVSRKGEELGFKPWIHWMALGGLNVSDEYVDEVTEFFRREAGFLTDRKAVNAFKHGRMQRPLHGRGFQISRTTDDGETKELVGEMEGSLQWLDWDEKFKGEEAHQTLKFGFEETNASKDFEIVAATSALMSLITDIRKPMYTGEEETDVFLPDLDHCRHVPQKLHVNLKTAFQKRGQIK